MVQDSNSNQGGIGMLSTGMFSTGMFSTRNNQHNDFSARRKIRLYIICGIFRNTNLDIIKQQYTKNTNRITMKYCKQLR